MNIRNIRIGYGFDVHRFSDSTINICNQPLILMGCVIPYDRFLLGHSDADVMIHAVIDSILGAACLGDLGCHFADNNMNYYGVDSVQLLKAVVNSIRAAGWCIVNLDVCLIGERPKISIYTLFMRQYISEILNVGINDINIKATTTEGLGDLGRREGLGAQAIVLLSEI